MSTTIANFKLRVAAMANRDPAMYVVSGVDNLLYAMNDVRRAAQRNHAFELLRGQAYISTSVSGANWMTGAFTTPTLVTQQMMRRVDSVWNFTSSTPYLRTSYIDFASTSDFRRTLPLYDTAQLIITNQPAQQTRRTFAYLQGQNIFITNVTTAATYMLEGITFLDDLTGAEPPDMFLTYFTDWFVYATLGALNSYVKADERFQIDQAIMASLWQSVLQMDGDIANSGQWTNLD